MDSRTRTSISKFLSLVLRHKPEAVGIELDSGGWVDVDTLLDGCRAHGRVITLEVLEEIVATSPKQRFAFSEDRRKIRASQGHSVKVELGYDPADPPEVLYQGTVERFLSAIRSEGLKPMKRHHVHLSADAATAKEVARRRGKPVVLHVRAGEMSRDGYTFYVSANAVWLTDHVPPRYIDFDDQPSERPDDE